MHWQNDGSMSILYQEGWMIAWHIAVCVLEPHPVVPASITRPFLVVVPILHALSACLFAPEHMWFSSDFSQACGGLVQVAQGLNATQVYPGA
jgi:hypothetical protein